MTVPYKPQQSPIDLGLATTVAAVFPQHYLDLRWESPLGGEPDSRADEAEFSFKNLNPTVGLALGGKFFRLLRYHFHAPSEHKVCGKSWPLEIHVVHQSPEDQLFAVLGIMVEPGAGRPSVNEFFKKLSARVTQKQTGLVIHDPRDLLPVDRGDFYRYEGSLTTKLDEDNPETVSWLIFRESLRVDTDTLDEFILNAHKAKPIQDPARRFVLCNFIP